MIDPVSYLATANKLLDGPSSDTDIRRAVSTAYYALFHHLCRHFGCIILQPVKGKFHRAWLQAYRNLDHGVAKTRCNEVRNTKLGFPENLVTFADTFIELQQWRQEADYNPAESFSVADAKSLIANAEIAIKLFDAEPSECQRAFVVFLGLNSKRGK